MIYDKTFDTVKEHYNLDELHAEKDYDREHKSPCGKYKEYDYKVFVRKGNLRFKFHTAVHWKAHVTKIPWYEIWTRIFVGDEIRRYSVDHVGDAEYLMHMIIEGLEQGKANEQRNEI